MESVRKSTVRTEGSALNKLSRLPKEVVCPQGHQDVLFSIRGQKVFMDLDSNYSSFVRPTRRLFNCKFQKLFKVR